MNLRKLRNVWGRGTDRLKRTVFGSPGGENPAEKTAVPKDGAEPGEERTELERRTASLEAALFGTLKPLTHGGGNYRENDGLFDQLWMLKDRVKKLESQPVRSGGRWVDLGTELDEAAADSGNGEETAKDRPATESEAASRAAEKDLGRTEAGSPDIPANAGNAPMDGDVARGEYHSLCLRMVGTANAIVTLHVGDGKYRVAGSDGDTLFDVSRASKIFDLIASAVPAVLLAENCRLVPDDGTYEA